MSLARSGPGPESPATLGPAVRLFTTHASPRLLTAIVAVCVGFRLVLADWSAWDAVVAGAIVAFWPVHEWLIHVFILHYQPVTLFGRTLDFRTPRKHRAHHVDPWRIDLVFIPTHVFLYAALVGAIALVAAPTPALAFTGLAVYFLLSLHYEWVHFLVHTRYEPRSRIYRRLWTNHRLHHFKNEHHWFGVTMLAGDRLLRTAPDHRCVETSPSARALGLDETLGEKAECSQL